MEAMSDFASRANLLDETLEQLAELTDKGAARSVARLKVQLDGFEPAVTVLGQVKSGKTSLINAMAGWADLLPSDVNPWTSVVTSLHLAPGREKKETGAKFKFMTEDEWDGVVRTHLKGCFAPTKFASIYWRQVKQGQSGSITRKSFL